MEASVIEVIKGAAHDLKTGKRPSRKRLRQGQDTVHPYGQQAACEQEGAGGSHLGTGCL